MDTTFRWDFEKLIQSIQIDAFKAGRKSARHVCRESKTCACDIQGLEPNEECPVHGAGEYPPRCGTCGRFITRDNKSQ